jgi:hypothetical protein
MFTPTPFVMVRNIFKRLRATKSYLDNIKIEREICAVRKEEFFDPHAGRTYCKITNMITHRYWWERIQ